MRHVTSAGEVDGPASGTASRLPSPGMGVLAAAVAAVLFGINATVSKVALDAGIETTELVQLRSVGSAICLMAFLAVTRPRSIAVGGRELGYLLAVGVIGIGMVQWLYFVAIDRLPVGIALLLEYLAPVLVVLWVRFVRRDAVRKRMWAALALSVLGLAVVAQVWQGLTLDGLGVLAGLGAAAALAAYYLSSERGMSRRDPLSLAAWTFTASGLFWSILRPPWTFDWAGLDAVVGLPGPLAGVSLPMWALLLWVIVLGTVVPYSLVLVALRALGSSRTGLLGMAEPVMAGLVAWIVLSQALNAVQILGALAILVGIVLAETARQSTTPEISLPTR